MWLCIDLGFPNDNQHVFLNWPFDIFQVLKCPSRIASTESEVSRLDYEHMEVDNTFILVTQKATLHDFFLVVDHLTRAVLMYYRSDLLKEELLADAVDLVLETTPQLLNFHE